MKKEKQIKVTEDNKQKEDNTSYWLPIGMCLGISIGTTIGAATNNMGLWLSIGLSVGLCIGLLFSSSKDTNSKK